MFGPQEAVSLGFASRVVEGARQEVVKEALQVAKTIASKSPVAVAGTKRMLLRESRRGDRLPVGRLIVLISPAIQILVITRLPMGWKWSPYGTGESLFRTLQTSWT